MNPQDQQPHQPQSQPSSSNKPDPNQRDATANMIRDQISRLFGDPTAVRQNSQTDASKTPPEPIVIHPASDKPEPQLNNRARTLHDAEQLLNQQRRITPPQREPATQQRQPAVQPSVAKPVSAPAAPVAPQPTNPTPAQAPAPTGPTKTTTTTPTPQPQAQPKPQSESTKSSDSPYQQTQQNTATISSDQWRKYHSSWQQYYQKYYERYYVESLASQAPSQSQSVIGSSQSASQDQAQPDDGNTLNKSQAVKELRGQIRQRVSTSAEKVRKSRHFIPIIAASCVLVLFLFLQYNRVLFASVEAYIAPGSVNPGDIIVDPNSTEALSDDPTLIIPKLNINVPAVYNGTMGSTNQQTHERQMKAMENGVAWFGIPGADAKPGQNGNVVLSGHSSNDVIDPGEYKFIFARLDKLKEGDTIYLTYDGVRYTYRITGSQVVKPTELDALRVGDDKPTLTLITCTPLGTSLNRLLVYADQISPDPTSATEANDFDASDQDVEMPGNSPTMLQRIFGGDS